VVAEAAETEMEVVTEMAEMEAAVTEMAEIA
jgi:hypothetical protein